MFIDSIAYPLMHAPELKPLFEKLSSGEDSTSGIPLSARPLMIAAAFALHPRPMLVVVPGEETAERLSFLLASYLDYDSVQVLPGRSAYPWSDRLADSQEIGRRIRALRSLQKGDACIVVTSSRTLLRRLPPPASLPIEPLVFVRGASLAMPYDQIARWLLDSGYIRMDKADVPGTFSFRGDTLDIFEVTSPYLVRIELFGEEVESLRHVIALTGQSISDVETVSIYPCTEFPLGYAAATHIRNGLMRVTGVISTEQEQHLEMISSGIGFPGVERYVSLAYKEPGIILDYLHTDTLTVLVEPRALFDDAAHAYEDIAVHAKAAHCSLAGLYLKPEELDFGTNQRWTLLSLMRAGTSVDLDLTIKNVVSAHSEQRFMAQIQTLLKANFLVVLGIADRKTREDIKLLLTDYFIPLRDADGHTFIPNVVNILSTDIPVALIIPQAQLALLNLSDSSSRACSYRGRKHIDPTSITFPYSVGDYVVHATHGIALFKEFLSQEVCGVRRDYLLLEYAHGDKLYVPVEQVDRVTRYVGSGADAPRLTRLNTSDWTRATNKARKAVKELAFDLVDLYARRSCVAGYAYEPDGEWQQEMELMFPYEETPDQLSAITDVKVDMESTKPMDRLVCGDVGFGKTEVAVRAAFKAIQSGKQVMMLCPTTILVQQHYTTFQERFAPFGITVDVLSRFRSEAQQKKTLEAFSAGTVDMLVGTHRLLSSDVNPKDLGLVIIDEEQRFGVQHKEHLKNLREHIDILTLSATPIPRTLQMSLAGVRDMSLIETPPPHRRQIEVTVGEWDENLVSAAIRQEMARDGQVYYVSNRVKSIDEAVRRVQAVAPEARIGVAHGRMDAHQIEAVMETFVAGETDVLISTTIIESGIDNPHTNTLIIEDSQRLGLAQLYQLKGRVGRSRTQAYAYFLFPPDRALTQEAIDRLLAIQEFQELGSGMKIAMRDLEIRGAGSLFGGEQSGNVSSVGFDLFASMLAEAVSEVRGDTPLLAHETVIDVPGGFFLPEEYVPATDERVLFYRRFAAAEGLEDADRIEAQLLQLHGDLPVAARNMVDRVRVRFYMEHLGVHTIGFSRNKLIIDPLELDPSLRSFVAAAHGVYLVKSKKLTYPVSADEEPIACARTLLDYCYQHARDEEEGI